MATALETREESQHVRVLRQLTENINKIIIDLGGEVCALFFDVQVGIGRETRTAEGLMNEAIVDPIRIPLRISEETMNFIINEETEDKLIAAMNTISAMVFSEIKRAYGHTRGSDLSKKMKFIDVAEMLANTPPLEASCLEAAS